MVRQPSATAFSARSLRPGPATAHRLSAGLSPARRGRLEFGLLREPLRRGLGPHRLQLVNVVLFCGLAALTVSTGAYAAIALQLPGIYRILLRLFFTCLVAFVLLALLPLRRVRLGSTCWWRPGRSSWQPS